MDKKFRKILSITILSLLRIYYQVSTHTVFNDLINISIQNVNLVGEPKDQFVCLITNSHCVFNLSIFRIKKTVWMKSKESTVSMLFRRKRSRFLPKSCLKRQSVLRRLTSSGVSLLRYFFFLLCKSHQLASFVYYYI
jgi:hypothetical protein